MPNCPTEQYSNSTQPGWQKWASILSTHTNSTETWSMDSRAWGYVVSYWFLMHRLDARCSLSFTCPLFPGWSRKSTFLFPLWDTVIWASRPKPFADHLSPASGGLLKSLGFPAEVWFLFTSFTINLSLSETVKCVLCSRIFYFKSWCSHKNTFKEILS